MGPLCLARHRSLLTLMATLLFLVDNILPTHVAAQTPASQDLLPLSKDHDSEHWAGRRLQPKTRRLLAITPESHGREFTVAKPPTPYAHGSSLVMLQNGDTLVVWFGGESEGKPSTAIWRARRTAKGVWQPAYRMPKVNYMAHWNPVVFWTRPEGKRKRVLWLHFKVGFIIDNWKTYAAKSTDDGVTWSKPQELVPGNQGGRGCVKDKPVVMNDGTIICGASLQKNYWRSFADRSMDGGVTWQATKRIPVLPYPKQQPSKAYLIQPTLWKTTKSNVHMMMRSWLGGGFYIYRSDSKDGGKTWTPAQRTQLRNPNSGIDVTRLSDGTLVLAYNPSESSRTPLRLSISTDNGATWPLYYDLETAAGEYSYPGIIAWTSLGASGKVTEGVSVSYTYNRKRIAYFSISKPRLLARCSRTSPNTRYVASIAAR